MNIALVEDLKDEQMRISHIIKEYASANHINIELSIFNNAESFLDSYRPLKYTLIFMDIYMNEMTGIEAARQIRTVDNDSLIVFLTTSRDHAFSAFDVHAYHYIIKPESEDTLKTSLNKVLDDIVTMHSTNIEKLMISLNGTDTGVPYHNIKYVSSNRNYVQIICKDGSEYHPRMTFSEICNILNKDNRFLRINRGILINMDYITDFGDTCELEGGHTFPVNVREKKSLNQIRRNYVFNKLHNRHERGGSHI